MSRTSDTRTAESRRQGFRRTFGEGTFMFCEMDYAFLHGRTLITSPFRSTLLCNAFSLKVPYSNMAEPRALVPSDVVFWSMRKVNSSHGYHKSCHILASKCHFASILHRVSITSDQARRRTFPTVYYSTFGEYYTSSVLRLTGVAKLGCRVSEKSEADWWTILTMCSLSCASEI